MPKQPNLLVSLSDHQYPKWMMRFPWLIHIQYALGYFFQLRKWYVMPAIKKAIKQAPTNGVWIDMGCGEGQYLVPIARKFPQWECIGVDIRHSNIAFLQTIINHQHTKTVVGDILTYQPTAPADLITCIGLLQYIDDDIAALRQLGTMLQPEGKLLLYVPINGTIHLPIYRYLLNKYEHYETVNNRKRIYRYADIETKMQAAGLQIEKTQFTYGIYGRLSHEITNCFLLVILSANWLFKCLASLLFLPVIPLILLLMLLDYVLPVKQGNGVLVTGRK